MDLRPQAHEIIRTWLFSTVVRSHFEHGALPWRNAAISGWVLDPDRKKMSKSKGNVVTPIDAARASTAPTRCATGRASGRPGTDTAVRRGADEGRPPAGDQDAQRVEVRARAGRLGRRCPPSRSPSRSTGRCSPALAGVVDEATAAFEAYDYTRALERTETFFWSFCDDYVELVKAGPTARGRRRPRPPQAALAHRAVDAAAAVRPGPAVRHRGGLVVVADGLGAPAAWPVAAELPADGDPAVVTAAAPRCSAGVRKAKSDAKASMRADVETATVIAPEEQVALVEAVRGDLIDAGRIATLAVLAGSGPLTVQVVLAPVPEA